MLPRRLRRGIREALDGRHGMLRMDPQALAERIGAAIDLELRRLARIRIEHARTRHMAEALRQADTLFVGSSRSPQPARQRGPAAGAQARLASADVGNRSAH